MDTGDIRLVDLLKIIGHQWYKESWISNALGKTKSHINLGQSLIHICNPTTEATR